MTCGTSLEVKYTSEKTSGLGNTHHICLPGGKKSRLPLKCAPLSLRCFLQQSETRSPKGWQLCVGILDCSWNSGEGQHRCQSTGTVSCLHGQPPKMFLLNTALISNAAGSGCTAFKPSAKWWRQRAKGREMCLKEEDTIFCHVLGIQVCLVNIETWYLQEV